MLACLASGMARAERADREQKAKVSAIYAGWEDTSATERVYKMEGDIVITQGTLRVTGERGVLNSYPDGRLMELRGEGAKQVTFRQKREGENDFVEAWADRGDYDERTDTIRLYANVRFKSGGDTVKGEYLTYNSVTEKMEIRSSIPGERLKAAADGGKVDNRVIFEIEPRAPADKKAPVAK